jgi:histidine triad (HIT) family protein
MNSCLFCKIVNKEIPSRNLFENEDVLAFHDVNPQAPLHILIIPKAHRESLFDFERKGDGRIQSLLLETAVRIARDQGLEKEGFRLVANTGRHGGQTVSHFHFHLLAGRPMNWPPG